MGDDSVSRNERNEYLFHHLVAMFQTLALQQLGKLVNPITGKLERDLQQAKITIDMLQMIKDRTLGNLKQSEQMILDRALLELQMNFVDEKQKPEEDHAGEAGESSPEETSDRGEAEVVTDVPEDEEVTDADAKVEADASSADRDKAKAKTTKRKSSRKKKSS